MGKKKKIIIAAVAVVVVLVGAVGGVLAKGYFDREKAVMADVEEIASLVETMYDSAQKENIAEDLTEERVEEIAQRIAQREEEGLVGRAEEDFEAVRTNFLQAQEMLRIRTNVRALLDKDGAVVEKADAKLLLSSLEEWETTKPAFYAEMLETITEAQTQLDQITAATEAVAGLFSDYTAKTVREDVTAEEVATVKEKVNAIKQLSAKEALLAETAVVEEAVQQREEEAAAEEARRAQEAANNAPKSSTSSNVSSTYAEALAVAQSIADGIGPGTDLERVSAAAQAVSAYYSRGVHKESGPYYSTPYGVFIAGESSCAGCTRALGMVLSCMGYSWEHVNENQWTHQWVRLTMDGQIGYADGQVGWAGYGSHPVE